MKLAGDEKCPEKESCECERYCVRAQRAHPPGTCFDWTPFKDKCPLCRSDEEFAANYPGA